MTNMTKYDKDFLIFVMPKNLTGIGFIGYYDKNDKFFYLTNVRENYNIIYTIYNNIMYIYKYKNPLSFCHFCHNPYWYWVCGHFGFVIVCHSLS